MKPSKKYEILEGFTKGSMTLDYTEENIEVCGEHIRRGELVGFPTETVYGLGADATSDSAVLKIFRAKERPLNDPVIVHVTSFETAEFLIHEDINPNVLKLVKMMTVEFWPGPLTLVVKASEKVSPNVTGGTGNVGIRCPSNEIARALIDMSGRPIAAPSANRFGHVSPTTYHHVEEDLGNTSYPIAIIKGGEKEECCKVGIESTVCRLYLKEKNVVKFDVLRKGGTSTDSIKKFADRLNSGELGENLPKVVVEIKSKVVKMDSNENMNSPGQLITHYAPTLPSFLISNFGKEKFSNEKEIEGKDLKIISVKDAVLIDFNGFYRSVKKDVLQYFDLSPNGNCQEAANLLFKRLRDAEKVRNAKVIVLPNMKFISKEHSDACFDRLYRAASGKYCFLTGKEIFVEK